MVILAKTWSCPDLRPIDRMPIVINFDKYIKKEDGTFFLFNCSGEVETQIGDFDAAVYATLREQTKMGTSRLTDDLLAALVCIDIGLITQAQLDEKIKCVLNDVQLMNEGVLPVKDQKWIRMLFEEGGKTGHVTEEGQKMVRDLMARDLVIENIKDSKVDYIPKDPQTFINLLWDSINKLVDNKAILNTIYQVKDIDNSYFFPKKMMVARVSKNATPEEVSKILSTIYNKYDDVVGKAKTRAHILHEMHPDDVIDFSRNSPIAGGIALTQACQFRCRYCSFSSGECGNNTLSIDSIKVFVDMLVKNVVKRRLITKKTEPLKIIIAGGGEPTYDWKTFVETVEYIRQITEKHNIKCNLDITTNGCHSKEQTDYIIKNFSRITLSFDGLPETQNRNRPFANGKPTFDIVNETIKRLDNAQANYNILSVVQPEDFHKIKEMATFIFANYPNVRVWNVRPTISVGRATTSSDYNGKHESYLKSYLDAAQSLGFPRKMFSGIFIPSPIEIFCGTLFGANPWLVSGDKIVTCQDAQDDAVVMGRIVDGQVILDKNHDVYATKAFETIKKCGNCLAYHFCGGDCPLQDSTPEMRKYSLWKCHEIYSYWQTVLNQLNKLGTFDGWYLDHVACPELENVNVYKMSRS